MRLIAADSEAEVEGPEPYGACSSLMADVLVSLEAPQWSPRMPSDSHARFAIGSPRRCLVRHAARASEVFAPGVGDRNPAVAAEVATRDLRPRRILPPLVLGTVDHPDHALDQLRIEAMRDQLGRAMVLFDVVVEDVVEQVVWRQRVGVDL